MSTTKVDLRQTITSDHIEMNLERKLQGLIFLLDSLEISSDSSSRNSSEGFGLLAETVQGFIDTEIKEIKTGVDYMFGLVACLEVE